MSSQQQPPPRKGNYAKVLRNLHTEQLSKVQWKHQHECELLDDMRNFIIKRCAVEKSYGEAMQKISANYLHKKMPPIHETSSSSDANQQWTVWSVWRTLLEETDKLAKAKLAIVEVFQQQIADDAKTVRQNKMQLAKKNLDLLKVVQGEVQGCVTELDKLKKVYVDDEHVSHDARDKAREAEEKLKKKKGNIFQSMSSLQKTSAKLGSRRDLCEEKSTHARNSYLLQLASANAHQNRYFHVDLKTVIKTLDGGMYEKLSEYFSIISRTELITCSAWQNSYGKIREQANSMSRDYDLACFSAAFPILNQHIVYDFEPCDNDQVLQVEPSHGTANELNQCTRQYASRVIQESKSIRDSLKVMHTLQALKDSGNKTDPNDANGADLETKIEELKNKIRRSETARVKAEARLDYLRQGGVKVDDFLQDAEGLATLGLARSSSQLSFRESGHEESDLQDGASDCGSRMAGHDIHQEEEEEEEEEEEPIEEGEHVAQAQIDEMRATWQDPVASASSGWNEPSDAAAAAWNDSEAQSPMTSVQIEAPDEQAANQQDADPSIIRCIAFYDYVAQNVDELSILENEELEVLLAFSEGDGWVKARNYKGEEGFVPQNYLDLPENVEFGAGSASTAAAAAADVDAQQEEIDPPASNDYGMEPEVEDEANYGLEAQVSFSSVDYTYKQDQEPSDDFPAASLPALPTVGVAYCRALYDYEATSDEELSFFEGDVLVVLKRNGVHDDDDDVDDGWWQGQLLPDGPMGVFPSLVVEECGPQGEELTPRGSPVFDEDSAPPPGTPPVVPTFLLPPETIIITQPTPETEFPSQDIFDQNQTITETDEDPSLESAPPTVNDTIAEEDEQEELDEEVKQVLGGLSSTQIVVTASTPMIDDDEHMQSFATADTNQKEEKDQSETPVPAAEVPAAEVPAAEVPAAEVSTAEVSAAEVSAVKEPNAAVSEELPKIEASEKEQKDREILSELDDEFVKLESAKESYA